MKEIKCSRCGCKRLVPDNWRYKQCPKCHKAVTEYAAKKRKQNQKQKERQIQREIQLGNLNFGLNLETKPFMSWERFKQIWGETATIEQYKKAKKQHIGEKKHEIDVIKGTEFGKILLSVPMNDPAECRKYRLAHMNLLPSNYDELDRALIIQNHCSCEACKAWYVLNKKKGNIGKIHGLNLW